MVHEDEVTDDLLNRVLYLYWDEYGQWYRARIKKVALPSPDPSILYRACAALRCIDMAMHRNVMQCKYHKLLILLPGSFAASHPFLCMPQYDQTKGVADIYYMDTIEKEEGTELLPLIAKGTVAFSAPLFI